MLDISVHHKNLYGQIVRWSPDEEESFKEELRTNISIAWEKAMNDPYPDLTATMKYVFSYKSKEES